MTIDQKGKVQDVMGHGPRSTTAEPPRCSGFEQPGGIDPGVGPTGVGGGGRRLGPRSRPPGGSAI
jgi:hypothetical protein